MKTTFPVKDIRKDFPILETQNMGKPLVYLDNGATTQRPAAVIDAVSKFYLESNANVHRGIYELGERATRLYDDSREIIARFINAPTTSIIFTRGTTEALNLVANSWGRSNLKPGDEILISEMEHHSNIVPWQLIAKETGARLRYIPLLPEGRLDLENIDTYFTPDTKLFSITHQSNALGVINPVKELIARARKKGIITVVDAAQSIPHLTIDVEELGCDFLAFSGHKMVGPTGIGVLYGRKELLEEMPPYQGGGEMISTVTMEESTWAEIPHKFEAGTPNIAGAVGLGAAVEYLSSIGMDNINAYLDELTEYTYDLLSGLDFVKIFGTKNNRGSVFSFAVDDVHPHDLAQFLDEDGIAVRAGHHCAQPLMKVLGVPATARASFYFYNTKEEAHRLAESLEKIYRFFKG